MRHDELTSLLGLRDSDGDRLHLVRSERPDGTRGYILRIGTGRIFLTPRELTKLRDVIRAEVPTGHWVRVLARTVWLLSFLALVALLASSVSGPLFAYPWSN